jgi:hypothetical protein
MRELKKVTLSEAKEAIEVSGYLFKSVFDFQLPGEVVLSL